MYVPPCALPGNQHLVEMSLWGPSHLTVFAAHRTGGSTLRLVALPDGVSIAYYPEHDARNIVRWLQMTLPCDTLHHVRRIIREGKPL